MKNIINLYGDTGVGKTTLIKELILENENENLIIDFQGGYDEHNNNANIILLKEKQTKTNCLKLINNITNEYKYVFFENFTHILPLVEKEFMKIASNNNQTTFVLVTHGKLSINSIGINYFEIKEDSSVQKNKEVFNSLIQ